MSQENVKLVREVFAAYERGDLSKAMSYYQPDVVFNPAEEPPVHGRDAVIEYVKRWEEPWDDYKAEGEEFIDAGDCVVVTFHAKGRGRASGIEVDARSYQVYKLHNGKLARMDEYTDRREALEAAGLSE
jgi:ketosteroid isomerase-like protein